MDRAAGNANGAVGGGARPKMPRPRKHRRVWHEPLPAIFKPVGVPLRHLETIIVCLIAQRGQILIALKDQSTCGQGCFAHHIIC